MPGGCGTFGAGTGPAGGPIAPAAVTPTTLVSSWAIDPTKQRYVLDDNGNPVAMDGTDQRVYVIVCQTDTSVPVITPTTLRQQAAALRAALAPLVAEGAITNLQISATDDGKAESLKGVSYTNAQTNVAVTLKVR